MDVRSKKTVPKMEGDGEDERWLGVSFAPEHSAILAIYAGPMTQKAADMIVEQTGERIDEDNLPLFVTDGRKFYAPALLNRYHETVEFPKTGNPGRPRQPMCFCLN